MQLIRIQNIPIQYKFQLERARLELQTSDKPVAQLSTTPIRPSIHTRDIQVQLDSTAMRASMGLKQPSANIKEQGDKGMQAAQDATAQMSATGTQIGQIQNSVSITQLMTQKLFEQPETITTFIPSVGPDISWIPNEMSMNIQPGELNTDWEIDKNVLSYVPGKFQIIIDQYPSVKIEYIGEPNYVPPSANPNYEEKTA